MQVSLYSSNQQRVKQQVRKEPHMPLRALHACYSLKSWAL